MVRQDYLPYQENKEQAVSINVYNDQSDMSVNRVIKLKYKLRSDFSHIKRSELQHVHFVVCKMSVIFILVAHNFRHLLA